MTSGAKRQVSAAAIRTEVPESVLPLARELRTLLETEPLDLARAALLVAKVEYPRLDPLPTLSLLDELGGRGLSRVGSLDNAPVRTRIQAINRLLYDDERFAGNRKNYGDFRNNLLNDVVERRTGIPITLAVVYMEVARRSGLEVLGVSFPGHFLMRVPADAGEDRQAIILDPFDSGRELDEGSCRQMLRHHLGEQAPFDRRLLQPCTGRQLLARILNNLKRTYVEQRSFPQALSVTELLLTVDPSVDGELRDRGLLSYHLDDFPAALRDLEVYLRLHDWKDTERDERDRIRDHVKTLRHRAAALN
jgi:regulator of sirC expression with transglutaminase-like and TPR domain